MNACECVAKAILFCVENLSNVFCCCDANLVFKFQLVSLYCVLEENGIIVAGMIGTFLINNKK